MVFQIPRSFSRIAGRSPRAATDSKKLLGSVSPTVRFGLRILFALSPPRLAFLPAALAPGAALLGAEVELLDVLAAHQPLAGVRHHDAADLQHIAVLRGL